MIPMLAESASELSLWLTFEDGNIERPELQGTESKRK
jgi:hypothetical protein